MSSAIMLMGAAVANRHHSGDLLGDPNDRSTDANNVVTIPIGSLDTILDGFKIEYGYAVAAGFGSGGGITISTTLGLGSAKRLLFAQWTCSLFAPAKFGYAARATGSDSVLSGMRRLTR